MANPTRARSRKRRTQPRGGTYRRALSARTTGGQGVRREAGSERLAEKYRAVIEGSHPHDEPVGQRWGEVEPALWGRRRPHSPTVSRCLRTARYGRSRRDPRRTRPVPGWHRDQRPYKPHSEVGSDAGRVVRRPNSTRSGVKASRPSDRQPGGLGKAAGKGGQCETGHQMSKDDRENQFRCEKPVRDRPRRLADWLNLTGSKGGPLRGR